MKAIDKVTVTNLDVALRICGIEIHTSILDRIIDLVELIEEKGDNTTESDVLKLKEQWYETYLLNSKL